MTQEESKEVKLFDSVEQLSKIAQDLVRRKKELSQTERKPLTDEEIDLICVGLWSGGWRKKAMQDFARAIEAAHGIKE